MRITTNAIIRDYKANLSASINNLNVSRTHVMTQRSFNSVAEDPASAARASQLHRKYYKNQDNIKMLENAQSRQDGQEDSLRQVSDMIKNISKNYNVQAMNGTNQTMEVRQSFASAIRQLQKSMVLSMNSSYEDTFLFAGSDGKNAPFNLSANGTLTYRGIDVNASKGSPEYDKLKGMSQENLYVDLGMGLEMDDFDKVVSSTAFNMSLPGINAVGYGSDENGMSNNVIILAGKLADALESENFNADEYGKLMKKFDSLGTNMMNQITELGVKSEFLNTTKDRLGDAEISIQEQMSGVEGVDMAEAITNYSWDQYAYNAALKVGTSILSSSFIDFMR
ncbi:flagellin [Lacrimispora amygdalina]|uniref:flagellin N-terminal helical domain-containing protein n=1 Tax=Lacrimispora amygdalina TaxID=253257 RepID=UPI000BE44791|nr:flagellin [Lacrimispora amygdalina]